MPPTQSTVNEMQNEATGTTASERNRKRALHTARNDIKSAWDDIRIASAPGCDRSVADDLVRAAVQRLELALSALKGIG